MTPDYFESAAMGFFPKDSRTSSKQAISVQAIEVLLYILRGIGTVTFWESNFATFPFCLFSQWCLILKERICSLKRSKISLLWKGPHFIPASEKENGCLPFT